MEPPSAASAAAAARSRAPTRVTIAGFNDSQSQQSNSQSNSQQRAKKKPRECPACSSTEIDTDNGKTLCTACGHVLDESHIVSEVSFVEGPSGASSVVGQFVPASGGSRAYRAGTRGGGHSSGNITAGSLASGGGLTGREAREMTVENGRLMISRVAATLNLTGHHVEASQRLFVLAVQHNFIQGRKTIHVVCACLYIVCRREKTPHMLIDFSDVLQTNVFVLGHTFLRFAALLNLELPVVDPSLYIQRFADKLEFGDQVYKVAESALRLVQRMKRDWLQTGRRPSGVCGASLLIAARMHGFRRTQQEIIDVVQICDTTLRRRLDEFALTPAARMSAGEFEQKVLASGTTFNQTYDDVAPVRPLLGSADDAAEEEGLPLGSSRIMNKLPSSSADMAAVVAVDNEAGIVATAGNDDTWEVGTDPPAFARLREQENGALAQTAAETGKASRRIVNRKARKLGVQLQPVVQPQRGRGRPKASATAAPPAIPAVEETHLSAGELALQAQADFEMARVSAQIDDLVLRKHEIATATTEYVAAHAIVILEPRPDTAQVSGTLAAAERLDDSKRPSKSDLRTASTAKRQRTGSVKIDAGAMFTDDETDMSDLDEPELVESVSEYLNSPAEVALKSQLWHEMNKDYLELQEQKRRLSALEVSRKASQDEDAQLASAANLSILSSAGHTSLRRRTPRSRFGGPAESSSTITEIAVSSKINYAALGSLSLPKVGMHGSLSSTQRGAASKLLRGRPAQPPASSSADRGDDDEFRVSRDMYGGDGDDD